MDKCCQGSIEVNIWSWNRNGSLYYWCMWHKEDGTTRIWFSLVPRVLTKPSPTAKFTPVASPRCGLGAHGGWTTRGTAICTASGTLCIVTWHLSSAVVPSGRKPLWPNWWWVCVCSARVFARQICAKNTPSCLLNHSCTWAMSSLELWLRSGLLVHFCVPQFLSEIKMEMVVFLLTYEVWDGKHCRTPK